MAFECFQAEVRKGFIRRQVNEASFIVSWDSRDGHDIDIYAMFPVKRAALSSHFDQGRGSGSACADDVDVRRGARQSVVLRYHETAEQVEFCGFIQLGVKVTQERRPGFVHGC